VGDCKMLDYTFADFTIKNISKHFFSRSQMPNIKASQHCFYLSLMLVVLK